MANRRTFLGGLVAGALAPRLSWADAGNPAFVAAAAEPDGGYALYGLTPAGEQTFRAPLPARGHAAAAHPERPEAVAFSRRPGTYALVLNCVTGAVQHRLESPAASTFNGHGAFSMDGETLYTSEVVADTGEGRIGLWSRSQGYVRIGEIASGGIGPHEIRRMPMAETLVVANGGIRTGPDDRDKLNLDTMAPNLTYLDPEAGILEQVTLMSESHQASIRHLSLASDGLVAFAMQWEGPVETVPALLGLHRRGEAPVLAQAPDAAHQAMMGYAGSVAFFDADRQVAISSPSGGRVQVFSASGEFLSEIHREDVCGLACDGDALILTDGLGLFVRVENGHPVSHTRAAVAWDNHIVRL